MQSFFQSLACATYIKPFDLTSIVAMMKSILILVLVLSLLDVSIEQRHNQRRQVVKKYKRPNYLPKASTRISCPICASDFMSKRVTIDDPCFNPRFNLATAELELITDCPLASRNCTTETVYVNGVLTSIKRKCGQPTCTDSCVVAGLGLTAKTCSVCCPPFEYDSYNTDHLKPRECA